MGSKKKRRCTECGAKLVEGEVQEGIDRRGKDFRICYECCKKVAFE